MPQKVFKKHVELHSHLGAAVHPAILWAIAHRQGIKLPTKSYWEFEDMITMTGGEKNKNLDVKISKATSKKIRVKGIKKNSAKLLRKNMFRDQKNAKKKVVDPCLKKLFYNKSRKKSRTFLRGSVGGGPFEK